MMMLMMTDNSVLRRDRKKAASPSRSSDRGADRDGDDERKDGPSGASRGRSGSSGEGEDDVAKEPADAEAGQCQ